LNVFLSRRAKKTLQEFPAPIRRRIELKVAELFESPYPEGCRKLRGGPNVYRLRVGHYRILYTILSAGEILVFRIARREEAYQ
jgi:mRNA interferase RelE/StbE